MLETLGIHFPSLAIYLVNFLLVLLLPVAFLVPFVATVGVYGLELLVGFIQALIFSGLTLVFAAIAITSHHKESH